MDKQPSIQTIPSAEEKPRNILEEFDADTYVRKRLLEIKTLEDRVLYKDIVGDILCKLYNYSKEAFQDLEHKVLLECRAKQNDYAIYVSLTDKEHYDATDTFLHPMREEDTLDEEISYSDIQETFRTNGKVKLYTVFAEVGYDTIYKLIQSDVTFPGTVKTKRREYKATFQLSQNKEYIELVEQLYYIFMANYQSWVTVCTAYLSKMLDVVLCSVAGWNGGEEIESVQVDFLEYKSHIKYNQIPLWNLRKFAQKTNNYPDASIVKVNFEHQIYAHSIDMNSEYLVMNTDTEISNIRRLNGDLFITCPENMPHLWDLYQVNKRNDRIKYPYPVLSNQFKESFSGSLAEMFRKSVKTKAEIARLVESFSYGDRVKLLSIQLLKSPPGGWKKINYNMDSFIVDEIRTGNTKETLLLRFAEVGAKDFLNLDIMNFLVTQVQGIFPEYLCVGNMEQER